MKSSLKGLSFLIISVFILSACSSMKTAKMVPDNIIRDLKPQYAAGNYVSKVDGWVVLLDASSSMNHLYQDYTKFDIAKAFVKKMNDTLPPISAVSGLRTFGHAPQLTKEKTQLFYGMSSFDQNQMREGLSKINPSGGPTPMSAAISEVTQDLKNIKGSKAVIIVSDGQDLDEKPILAAKQMLAELGDDLCIYSVLVGDDEDGKVLLEKIANLSVCGFMVSALDTVPGHPMAEYVTNVFLSTDDQGLGYHKAVSLIKPLSHIFFNFDEYTLTREGRDILDKNIEILSQNPNIKLRIEGHASVKGEVDYNQTLSEKRASSVRNYLYSVGKITPNRLSIIGYGETKPAVNEVAPIQENSPEAKKNMRVEIRVLKY